MWLKLGGDFLNLDHVVRVRFNKSWNRDGECLVAEVEVLIGGDVKPVIRYRGAEAEILQNLFGRLTPAAVAARDAGRPHLVPVGPPADRDPLPQLVEAPERSASPTLHDI